MISSSDYSLRRIWLIWLVTFVVLVALTAYSSVLTSAVREDVRNDAEHIARAGEQRMLSQEIALLSSLYVGASSQDDRAGYRAALGAAIGDMREQHEALIEHGLITSELHRLFFEPPLRLDERIHTYLDAANALLDERPEQLNRNLPGFRTVIDLASTFRDDYKLVTEAYVDEAVEGMEIISRINAIRTAVALIVMIGQGFLVFLPALRRIRDRAFVLEHEVAARERVEAALRVSEKRFRALIESAPVVIFQSDIFGNITWVNSRWTQLTGQPQDGATMRGWLDSIHPEDRKIIPNSAESSSSPNEFIEELRIVRDGKSIHVQVNVVPMMNELDEFEGFIGTVTDISARKQVEAEKLRAEAERQRIKVLAEFIRDTSHDLRTPITVIKSGLYLCQKFTDVDRIHEKAASVEQHVDYLNTVIDQMQEMALLDTTSDITLSPVKPTDYLRDCAKIAAAQAETEGKAFRVDLPPELPVTLMASDKFAIAVRAILSNALRFTNPGGQITMRAFGDEQGLNVEVSDNGIGIASDEQERVFERFYKADKARGVGGAGLGLPIAKRVMDLHHGKIELTSELGVGTTVRLLLPLTTDRLPDRHGGPRQEANP